jgi:hypothetical protein
LTVTVYSRLAVQLLLSLAVTMKVEVPSWAGVPARAPVAELRFSHEGSPDAVNV